MLTMLRRCRIATTFLLAFLLLGLLFSCSQERQSFKIGCITPLSGDYHQYGDRVRKGADLALEEINAAGGVDGKKLEMVYEDDQLNAKLGVNAINKLITVDKVPVILGAFGSSVTLAVAPIAEKNKVVLITSSSTADSIKDAGEYIFRNVPTNQKQGADQAQFAYDELGARKAGILYINNDYGTTLRDSFIGKFRQLGGEITSEDAHNEKNTDFRTVLQKAAAKAPDVWYVPSHDHETGLLLKQAKELGIKIPVVGCDGSITKTLIEVAQDAAEGSVYSSFGWNQEFEDKFKRKYNENPDAYAATTYDAVYIIAEAIRKGGYTGPGIQKAMLQIKDFRGATGVTTFDQFGEVSKPYHQFIVRNGAFELYKK
jgi:branched-chain amino acid transport system substrate-binding protein